jgi:hypothetical protein
MRKNSLSTKKLKTAAALAKWLRFITGLFLREGRL